jgi:hypothetical protein
MCMPSPPPAPKAPDPVAPIAPMQAPQPMGLAESGSKRKSLGLSQLRLGGRTPTM